ncbi:MAG: NAD-dependent protein deacylase [Vagococcus sp.]
MSSREEALRVIESSKRLVFMTGAGVSVPSGIPDYRSMTGVYSGIKSPEYLLSHGCLVNEPDKFYAFVKQLYHPTAVPNTIHDKIAELDLNHDVTVISQNIDGLHRQSGSKHVVDFHGNLYDCYCQTCGETVDASTYLESYTHTKCGGNIRPDVVLYEEGLSEEAIETSIRALKVADVIVIVGTTFKVYPFSGLIQYRQPNSQIVVINKEPIYLSEAHMMISEPAETFFKDL